MRMNETFLCEELFIILISEEEKISMSFIYIYIYILCIYYFRH